MDNTDCENNSVREVVFRWFLNVFHGLIKKTVFQFLRMKIKHPVHGDLIWSKTFFFCQCMCNSRVLRSMLCTWSAAGRLWNACRSSRPCPPAPWGKATAVSCNALSGRYVHPLVRTKRLWKQDICNFKLVADWLRCVVGNWDYWATTRQSINMPPLGKAPGEALLAGKLSILGKAGFYCFLVGLVLSVTC